MSGIGTQRVKHLEITEYGRAATTALATEINRAKGGRALAAVTVIVPSNFVGLSVRRILSSQPLVDGVEPGLVNVNFVTPFQLVELLAPDLLLDTRPLTNPVLGSAVRRVLEKSPGIYRQVREHEATQQALAGLFTEMVKLDEAARESVLDEGSPAAKSAVEFYQAIADELDGFHTEHDLALAAAERADLAGRLDPYGHVLWYLPAPVNPAIGQFLDRVLTDAVSSSIILGLTGDEKADEPVLRAMISAGASVPAASSVAQATFDGPPVADKIVSVTDAPEEIREVTSRILDLIERGVPAHRIGVFYPSPDPYVRVIAQQFEASALPANGPDPRRLADSVAGRVVLAALGLPDSRWRRDRVISLISTGPVRSKDGKTYAGNWDDLSREAGVVRGLEDWRTKLSSAEESALTGVGTRLGEPDPRRASGFRELASFIDWLAELVEAVSAARTWTDRATAASALLVELLGPEHHHSSWPESEQVAFERVVGALERLKSLDEVEPDPSLMVFMRALVAELDVARGRSGRFGHGVSYGPLSSAVGQDLDAVFIVGVAEGLLPIPRRDDAMLPDEVRVNSLDQLESKADRLQHQHRAFLAALASAPDGGRTLVYPRGDLRSGREIIPSRWLLDTASALSEQAIFATDFAALNHPDEASPARGVVEIVGSYQSGIRQAVAATSLNERDLVAVAKVSGADGTPPVDHPLYSLIRSGLEMQRQRQSSRFTEFDGNLGSLVGQPVPLPSIEERAWSASRLESWAACGFKYYLQHVLGLADRDDPESIEDLSALDRGSIIHRVLECFIQEVIDAGGIDPTEKWSGAHHHRLHELGDSVFDEFESQGRTGRAVHALVKRDELHEGLDRFLARDTDIRSGSGTSPHQVEMDFGVKSGEPIAIELPNGKTVKFRGLIDRVDLQREDSVRVYDYKSGKGAKYKAIKDDPVAEGQTLQLGIYAEAAMRATGREHATAEYWMVDPAAEAERFGYEWDDERRQRFVEVLATITDGIEAGVFLANPGEFDNFRMTNESCSFCDFDSVCVRERYEQSSSKAGDPSAAVLVDLLPTPSAEEA